MIYYLIYNPFFSCFILVTFQTARREMVVQSPRITTLGRTTKASKPIKILWSKDKKLCNKESKILKVVTHYTHVPIYIYTYLFFWQRYHGHDPIRYVCKDSCRSGNRFPRNRDYLKGCPCLLLPRLLFVFVLRKYCFCSLYVLKSRKE